jgi:hypothetical protein
MGQIYLKVVYEHRFSFSHKGKNIGVLLNNHTLINQKNNGDLKWPNAFSSVHPLFKLIHM